MAETLTDEPKDAGLQAGTAAAMLTGLKVLSDPTDEEYADTKNWVESMKEGPFDPEHFHPAEVRFLNPKQRYRELRVISKEYR